MVCSLGSCCRSRRRRRASISVSPGLDHCPRPSSRSSSSRSSGRRGARGLQPPRYGPLARRGCEERASRRPAARRGGSRSARVRSASGSAGDAVTGAGTPTMVSVLAASSSSWRVRAASSASAAATARSRCATACSRRCASMPVAGSLGHDCPAGGCSSRRGRDALELSCPHPPRLVRSAGASGPRARHAERAVPRARLRSSSALHVV
jgi:hypothetical protein